MRNSSGLMCTTMIRSSLYVQENLLKFIYLFIIILFINLLFSTKIQAAIFSSEL